MSAEFIDANTHAMLKYAARLESIGLSRPAEQLCLKCARSNALADDGEDLITLLYGESIYDSVKTAKDALDLILVAKCAAELYNEIKELNSATSTSLPWVTRDEEQSDRRLLDFFIWLGRRRDKVAAADKDRISSAIYAIRTGSRLMMDDNSAATNPIQLIRFAARGSISIDDREVCYNGYN